MLLPKNNSADEYFGKSVATIALHNFQRQYAALVLFNSTLLCTVDIFLRSYRRNIIVGRGTFYPRFVKRTRQYILFGSDLFDIEKMLIWMRKHQFDNTGKYIVACLSERQKCDETDAVNIFWNYKILNIVLINEQNENKLNGYTYFHPEDCINTRPTKLKNWDSCLANNNHFKCRNMYPLKLKDFHGCPITVSTFNQIPYMNITNGIPTGADGDLLCIIAKAMNITLKIMTPRIGFGWGKVDENGTWSGSLGDVYYEWANFSMTSGSITLMRYSTFQISIDYAVITVAWVTHPSEVLPSSLKLLRPFQLNVRIALCISFVMFVMFTIFFNSHFFTSLRQILNVSIPDDTVFHSWELCMGLPVGSFPTNNALLCLTLFWIWYCFLVRTLYQVYLINSLQTDVYSPEFDTIEEGIASKYTFGGGLPLRDYYINNSLIYDNWMNVESNEIYPTMVKLSKGLKFVLAMNVETTNMFLARNPHNKLHILPQVIVNTPTAIFFKKYSPLANSVNVVLTRLRESGVIQKIYLNNTSKKFFKEATDNNMPISMEHYTGCYAILLTGWLLSTVCFIVEKLIPKRS